MRICQCCGKEISIGENAVEVRYGKIYRYAKPPKDRIQYNKDKVDFFHNDCDKSFRNRTVVR